MSAHEFGASIFSVSGLMRLSDFPAPTPQRAAMVAGHRGGDFLADGGSCLAASDGSWVIAPTVGEECVRVAAIDHAFVRRERQNFDPSGHYSRPDVLRLSVNRERQTSVELGGAGHKPGPNQTPRASFGRVSPLWCVLDLFWINSGLS